jgi:hypothetical protein
MGIRLDRGLDDLYQVQFLITKETTNMALLIRTDGSEEKVFPVGGAPFQLAKLQELVGGYIEMPELPDGRTMIVNETGKLDGLPKNEKATAIWQKAFPIEKYPNNNDQLVVGDVLLIGACNCQQVGGVHDAKCPQSELES